MAFQSVPTTLLFEIWSNKSNAYLEDYDCCYSSQFASILVHSVFPAHCVQQHSEKFVTKNSKNDMLAFVVLKVQHKDKIFLKYTVVQWCAEIKKETDDLGFRVNY